jgi:hypothetical protein
MEENMKKFRPTPATQTPGLIEDGWTGDSLEICQVVYPSTVLRCVENFMPATLIIVRTRLVTKETC